MKALREFWYNNVPGTFDVARFPITRRQIHVYGGPLPIFEGCQICEEAEWLSRIFQRDLFRFRFHECKTSKFCKGLCARQGNELWTHYHQNFWYSVGIDENLDAPKCLLLKRDYKGEEDWTLRNPDPGIIVARRQQAQACQVEIVRSVKGLDLKNYDFILMPSTGTKGQVAEIPKRKRGRIPIVMYGHDMWSCDYQKVLDRVRPDILLTPFPTSWRKNLKIPGGTKLWFYPPFPTMFFTRPNLSRKKKIDLLVIGTTRGHFYTPRVKLNEQLRSLPKRFKVVHSHLLGCTRRLWTGPTSTISKQGTQINFANKWSEFLGTARFVIFGPCTDGAQHMMLIKYYECLGSGAIPIFPVVPDLKRLGLRPMEHYIPFSRVRNKNKTLVKLLTNPRRYRHIAEAAVRWYTENADKITFQRFEDLVQKVTDYRYPRRLY